MVGGSEVALIVLMVLNTACELSSVVEWSFEALLY